MHPPELFRIPIMEEIMQESPFYDYVIQRGIDQGIDLGIVKGREQGIEQGTRQGMIESALTILEARFPDADVKALGPRLEGISDLDRLKALILNASLATSFDAFQEELAQ